MPEPAYQRIAEELRRQITSGERPPGSQLPTEYELRMAYGASRDTIRNAIKQLTVRGLVQAHPRLGTFVLEPIKPFVTVLSPDSDVRSGTGEGAAYYGEVRAQGRRPDSSKPPRIEVMEPTPIIAGLLQIPVGTQVVTRHQRRYIDGKPYSLETSFYPMSLVERGARELLAPVDKEEGCIEYLRVRLGIEQAGYRDLIAVRAADQDESYFFELSGDSPVAVFAKYRTSYDDQNAPIRVTLDAYPSDRNQFGFIVGTVPPQAAEAAAAGTASVVWDALPAVS
ncbi:MAG TPA: GntR family transcriptional regulator [Streptosporangiaceae bacterium]|jgi:GntR family transcriptional regulator